MKSVLIAIRPYWVFLIIAKAMGWDCPQEKTVEIRKTFPKDENWDNTVNIYCTKDKKSFNQIPKEFQSLMEKFLGKVVGKFVCDEITGHTPDASHYMYYVDDVTLKNSCLTADKSWQYGKGLPLYAWHISDLKNYDKPKELSEFIVQTFPKSYGCCNNCLGSKCKFFEAGYGYMEDDCNATFDTDEFKPLTRPPQSWCYVEETQNERI